MTLLLHYLAVTKVSYLSVDDCFLNTSLKWQNRRHWRGCGLMGDFRVNYDSGQTASLNHLVITTFSPFMTGWA